MFMSSRGVGVKTPIMNGQNEAFSRVLIDKALEFSGWNLLDSKQVQFELHTGNGRADYLLEGQARARLVRPGSEARGPRPVRRQGTGPRLCRKSKGAVHHPFERPRALVLEFRAGRSA